MVSHFFKKDVVHGTIYLDACLQGMGAIFNDLIYNVPTPRILKGMPIAAHEMFNILVAIRMFKLLTYSVIMLLWWRF